MDLSGDAVEASKDSQRCDRPLVEHYNQAVGLIGAGLVIAGFVKTKARDGRSAYRAYGRMTGFMNGRTT
ncbi:hypothetical protein BG22_05110 [Bifidobacterium sp. UTBIF-78]|nr:hypothetical protein BG22_05110 [Bifidobacterium sp. UTBIF-78]